jgi:ATP-dependent RNA helicase RhlE
MPFKSLEIIEPILQSLHEEGYSIPTPIQAQAIPIVLNGKDLLGCAQTGTGKTAAFAIPILQLLSNSQSYDKRKKIRSLWQTYKACLYCNLWWCKSVFANAGFAARG